MVHKYTVTVEVYADDAHQATHRMFDLMMFRSSTHIGDFSVRPTVGEMVQSLFQGEPNCKYCGGEPGAHDVQESV